MHRLLFRQRNQRSSYTLIRKSAQQPSPPHVPPSPPHVPPTFQLEINGEEVEVPDRPDIGTIGVPVGLRANHLTVTGELNLYQYDVLFCPDVPSENSRRRIITRLKGQYARELVNGPSSPFICYDGGKSLFTTGQLPFSSKDFTVQIGDEGCASRVFMVSIKFSSDFHVIIEDDVPPQTLQALDVVIQEIPSWSNEVFGRSFFDPTLSERKELGNGLHGWKGFCQSLRPTQMGLSLIIDVCAEAFFEPIDVSDYVHKLYSINLNLPLSDLENTKVKSALEGIMIRTTHCKPEHQISGLSTQQIKDLEIPYHAYIGDLRCTYHTTAIQ